MGNQSVSGHTLNCGPDPFDDDERVGISDAGTEWLRAENIALAAQMVLEDIERGAGILICEAQQAGGMVPAPRLAQLVEVVRVGKILLAGIAE